VRELLVVVAMTAFWIYVAVRQGQGVFWVLAVLTIGVYARLVTANPFRIEVGPERISASWVNGRSRSWPRADLRIRNADHYRSQLTFSRQLDVVDSRDTIAFRVFPELGNFFEFLDLLAPGVRRAVEERSARSWWSRDLFR
jgi:hypothetical protein